MGQALSFGRLVGATRCSLRGLIDTFRHEAAFRQEVTLAALLVPVALWLGRSPAEQALLIGVVLAVLVAELLNTAVEKAVDRIGPEHHALSGRAKDAGSAAVFVALVNAGLTWLLLVAGRVL